MPECIFCKIVKKELPAIAVYENDRVLAFLDLKPVHVGQTLVIPKNHSSNIYEIEESDLQAVALGVQKVAQAIKKGLGADGVNIIMNNEKAAGQVIFHPHIHVIPRFEGDGLELWHGKEASEESRNEAAGKIKDSLN